MSKYHFEGTVGGNLEGMTRVNTDFRRVIFTDNNQQLVLMSLKPGEDIGGEVHTHTTQFIRVEEGSGLATLRFTDTTKIVSLFDGAFVVIPAGTWHNIENTGDTHMKLYTVYSPPNHHHGRVDVQKPKED